ncbi:HNH endonuclease [Spongiibacter sp. IMCC21906]|uniref:HNH endonuclease n=1 Tax=Spongiibacter sp. IMCC21906 TaxID=1620392 RepID=UPI00062DD268|nr:HNH endonuclease [Spongiibacter sp. IMCC21906]AKH69276.1 HNH endonuclease [Spongiibacter sp. IMCC21906]
MNVISENNEVLNASVSIQEISGVFGLVMESRGGARGKPNERNTDYFPALDALLVRLRNRGLDKIRIHIVSSKALTIWNPGERTIEVDGNRDIFLKGTDLKDLRGKISKAQQEKKEDPNSKGGNPTKRILIEANLSEGVWKEVIFGADATTIPISEDDVETDAEEFSPEDAEKSKEKISRAVALRRGQPKFRKQLLNMYESTCAVTGTSLPPILEAAHIVPYMGEKTNHVTNGILLRADIHTLFDLGLLGINQSYEVVVSSSMKETEYEAYNGRKIKLPENEAEWPSLPALKSRPLPSRH